MKKIIFRLILILTLKIESGAKKPTTGTSIQEINQSKKCLKKSPITGMKYGYEFQHDVALTPFCLEHSKRTCCDQNNLYSILKQASFMKQNALSENLEDFKCFKLIQDLLCMECDGDIVKLISYPQSTGLKKGICPSLCSEIFQKCQNSLFFFDQNFSPERLNLCQTDSLVCSPLKVLTESSRDACEKMGFVVNERANTERNVLALYGGQEGSFGRQATCYNNIPSSKVYGRADQSIGYRSFCGISRVFQAVLFMGMFLKKFS